MRAEESFLKYIQYEKRYSNHTLQSYTADLSQFSSFLVLQFEEKDITKATHSMVRSWVVSLMELKEKASTINRKISTLKSLYKYFLKMGLNDNNPTSRLIRPKMEKRLPTFIEEKGMEKLFETFDYNEENTESYRNTLILEMLYSTGIRRSELMNLKQGDIDTYNLQIKVLGKRRKERIIPVTQKLISRTNVLIQLNKENAKDATNQYLFLTNKGEKIYPELIYSITKQHLSHVTTNIKKSPHVLRHSFATHLLNHGAEINAIKELMGHASLASTQVYTHNTIDKLKSIFKQAHPKA